MLILRNNLKNRVISLEENFLNKVIDVGSYNNNQISLHYKKNKYLNLNYVYIRYKKLRNKINKLYAIIERKYNKINKVR